MPESAAPNENRVTLSVFGVGESRLAIDVGHVREVVRWQPVSPLPRSPRLIEGVIDLRGSVVPVVDLARALEGGSVVESHAARIAIVEVDGMVMGLRVDAALEVLAVDADALEDPPALALQAGYDATRAVVRRPGAAPVLVLSLEAILESVYRSALSGREDAA